MANSFTIATVGGKKVFIRVGGGSSSTTVSWNGDITGRPYITHDETNFYKIFSTYVPCASMLNPSCSVYLVDGEPEEVTLSSLQKVDWETEYELRAPIESEFSQQTMAFVLGPNNTFGADPGFYFGHIQEDDFLCYTKSLTYSAASNSNSSSKFVTALKPIPKLSTPEISKSGNTLTIGDVQHATSYKIYQNNTEIGEVNA